MTRPSDRYARVSRALWRDEWWVGLGPPPVSPHIVWLSLLTALPGPLPGIAPLGIGWLTDTIGWTEAELLPALAVLERDGRVVVQRRPQMIWLPRAIRYQQPANQSHAHSWGLELAALPEGALRERAVDAMVDGIEHQECAAALAGAYHSVTGRHPLTHRAAAAEDTVSPTVSPTVKDTVSPTVSEQTIARTPNVPRTQPATVQGHGVPHGVPHGVRDGGPLQEQDQKQDQEQDHSSRARVSAREGAGGPDPSLKRGGTTTYGDAGTDPDIERRAVELWHRLMPAEEKAVLERRRGKATPISDYQPPSGQLMELARVMLATPAAEMERAVRIALGKQSPRAYLMSMADPSGRIEVRERPGVKPFVAPPSQYDPSLLTAPMNDDGYDWDNPVHPPAYPIPRQT